MKKTIIVFAFCALLLPSVSSASTFTQSQINAIIGLLEAFNVAQATIDTVIVDLTPTTLTITPSYQNIPVPLFGSIVNTQTQVIPSQATPVPAVLTPIVVNQPSPTPTWSILLSVDSDENASSSVVRNNSNPTIEAQNGMVHIEVSVYDPSGTYQKVPVTVTTDDPDLPSSWTFNADPHKINFFCVAPTYPTFPDNGCVNANPISIGTFNFTYTAEGVTKTQQITVLPFQ